MAGEKLTELSEREQRAQNFLDKHVLADTQMPYIAYAREVFSVWHSGSEEDRGPLWLRRTFDYGDGYYAAAIDCFQMRQGKIAMAGTILLDYSDGHEIIEAYTEDAGEEPSRIVAEPISLDVLGRAIEEIEAVGQPLG